MLYPVSYNTNYLQKKNNFTYNVISAPVNLPVTLALVKEYLGIIDNSKDTLLTFLIESATDFAQRYTNRTFIDTTYRTFRNTFDDTLQIRRSPVSAINSIEYLKDGVFTVLASTVYGFTDVNDYPFLFLKEDQVWPTDVDFLPQAIKIEFVAGFGADDTAVPKSLQNALMQHIVDLYTNRGDCSCDTDGSTLPQAAKAIYDQWRIMELDTPSNVNHGFLYR